MPMHARIKKSAEVFNLRPKGEDIDLTHVAEVERRIYKNGILVSYDLYFKRPSNPNGTGVTINVPADLVEVL